MANWTIDHTGASFTGAVGTIVSAGQVVNATIKPIDENGDSTGYYIEAKNFKIGEATETPTNTWTGGNVDTEVDKIVFSDNGTPGDISNTVNVAVHLNEFTPITESETISFDVDESDTPPTQSADRISEFFVTFPWVNTSQHAFAYDEDYSTLTTVSAGDIDNAAVMINESVISAPSIVFKGTFTSASGFHYTDFPTIVGKNLGLYEENYVAVVTPYLVNSLTSSFDIMIIYTPPEKGPNYPDPDNFLALGHKFEVSYEVAADEVEVTDTITSVSTTNNVSYLGGEKLIYVYGTAGAQYTIKLRNGTTYEWYDWEGGFQAGTVSESGTISASGYNVHHFMVPYSTVDVDYSVIITSVGGTILDGRVPTSGGDLQISQHGLRTVTIGPKTYYPGNFGTLPSNVVVARGSRYDGDSFVSVEASTATGEGSTKGSSTRLQLTNYNPDITPGMLVVHDDVPNDVMVLSVQHNYLVLNQAVDLISPVALKFIYKTSDIIPFSFTITPNGTVLTVATSHDPVKSVWGFNDVDGKVDGGQLANTNLTLDSTDRILQNMGVTGDGIVAGTVVSSVTNRTTLVLSTAHSGVLNDAAVNFRGANNPSVDIVHIQALEVGGDIVISGYIKAAHIDNTAKIQIFLDDIINVT